MTATAALEHAFPEPGKLFAERFVIDRLIGTGGHSRVYRARQMGFDREVAVKVLHVDRPLDRATRETIEKRFYREARLLSRLRGPNTLRVYDYGRTESGLLFMVSELVDGTDLCELLRSHGALSERRARRIFTQILQGLLEVHSEGFLHRDIKPSNVMVFDHLGERDRVKLLDFGIAKGLSQAPHETALTMAGFVIGTPGYMSPEQALGEPMQEGSDVFSAALVAFEMLTGRAPYAGLSPEQMVRSVRTGALRLPGTLEIDPKFAQVLHGCLEVDPTQRVARAADALRELGIAPDTVELPAAERPQPMSNVLTFPMHVDVMGRTTIDTLTDAETGETTAFLLPETGPSEKAPSVILEDEALDLPGDSKGVWVLVTLLIVAVIVLVALFVSLNPTREPAPSDAPPAVDSGAAVVVAVDALGRAARNAELDAVIAAKEAAITADEVPEESESMEFEEPKRHDAPPKSVKRPAPKRAQPAPRPAPEPVPAPDRPKKDFDVEMVDEL